MKKSEFEKLKVGDTVQLRTLEELKQLKCYEHNTLTEMQGIRDDNGVFRFMIISYFRKLLGEKATVKFKRKDETLIYIDCHGYGFDVSRQQLKGRE